MNFIKARWANHNSQRIWIAIQQIATFREYDGGCAVETLVPESEQMKPYAGPMNVLSCTADAFERAIQAALTNDVHVVDVADFEDGQQ